MKCEACGITIREAVAVAIEAEVLEETGEANPEGLAVECIKCNPTFSNGTPRAKNDLYWEIAPYPGS